MATRDRTALFLRYREEARALHGEPQKPLRSRSRPPADSAPAPRNLPNPPSISASVKRSRTGLQEPAWLHMYRDLVGDVAEVEKALSRLSALYAKHLLPSFGDGDHAAVEAAILELASELTQMLHSAEGKIRHIGAAPDGDGDALVRRNVQKRFATQLQDLSMAFRRKQKEYLRELQGQREVTGETGAAGGAAADVRVDFLGEGRGGGGTAFADAQVYRVDEEANDERTREIAKIAANINDLATIVKELATLVVDQGTILDRVDYNVEEVRSTTRDAVRELRIADRYQRKRHAFWCIIFLAIGCGVMLCLLLLKWFG